ncbi:formimidoylglutamase [Halalkalibacter krulwichiae]|uniref:Formimidoylglutamase n=1 Tax=Halalkalibacter krulwichiae TaxID=199441 RepID=A0A1X9MFW8_9BACI|nr:formimidoylglutamase [Halalkalibacter krulwichiae]ARK32347.1 Formimidoylglutamase [Halalkalibacter krulwichiae]
MYVKPTQDYWHGRIDDPTDRRSFRFHQMIKLANLDQLIEKGKTDRKAFAFLGFQCDEGVRRNKGRTGAKQGPIAIRKALSSLPWHFDEQTDVFDVGDVVCEKKEMEQAQAELGDAVHTLLRNNVQPMILGGGHETLYGHYLGVRKTLGPSAKLGIINIDAHFDMRSYDVETSSGTMFKQILDHDDKCGYFCVGIQKLGNTALLFDLADEHHVQYVYDEEVNDNEITTTFKKLDAFIDRYDQILLTLCTDSINSAFAPGVSAPTPFGLEPKTVRQLLRHIQSHEKTKSFDLCEVNPSLDEHNKTAKLAAQFIADTMMHVEQREKQY